MDADRLQRIWYGGAAVPWWLSALTPVYRALRGAHQLPYRLGWRRAQVLGVPVIVVGNLTVGGSGKTPLVIALASALRRHGWRPGVVSRGYGGRARVPMLLDAHPDPALVGDEPALIRRRAGVPVAIGRDRVAAARRLLAEGVDVVIADDGLQNPSLARDVEICVIDGDRRFGNGRLLPAGPLREPLTRLATLPLRVCNGGQPQAGETPMALQGEQAVNLVDGASRPLAGFAGTPVHAVAGIGHPERFFGALRARGIEVLAHAFADHHAYRPEDLAFGDERPVLMTEKDAIKCEAFASGRCWRVPVDACLPPAFEAAVAAAVAEAARR